MAGDTETLYCPVSIAGTRALQYLMTRGPVNHLFLYAEVRGSLDQFTEVAMTIDEYTQFLVVKDKLGILMQAFYARYVILHGEQKITFETYLAEPHGVTVQWKKDGLEGHFDVPLATLLNRNRWDEWILPRVVAAGQDKAASVVPAVGPLDDDDDADDDTDESTEVSTALPPQTLEGADSVETPQCVS